MSVRSFTIASSVDDAVAALSTGARPVAGGTDLVVGARQGKAPLPESIVAIDRLAELRGFREAEGGLELGALATHAEIASSPAVRERFTALADASAIVGSHATRAHGTVGGNVMNASPAMETGGPLICFGATAVLRSTSSERAVPIEELFAAPGRTTAEPGELLVRIDLPVQLGDMGSCYLRLEYRRQMEIAVVGATVVVFLKGGVVSDARIAITAVAPTIRRVPAAESALVGSDGGLEAAEVAAGIAAAAATPISDVRASERYRRAMTAVIARRAITAAVARARDQQVPVPASSALFGGDA